MLLVLELQATLERYCFERVGDIPNNQLLRLRTILLEVSEKSFRRYKKRREFGVTVTHIE